MIDLLRQEEEMMVDHALDDHLQPNSQSSVVVETVLQLRLLFLALLFGACPILSGDHVSWELLMQLLLHAEQEPFRISNEMWYVQKDRKFTFLSANTFFTSICLVRSIALFVSSCCVVMTPVVLYCLVFSSSSFRLVCSSSSLHLVCSSSSLRLVSSSNSLHLVPSSSSFRLVSSTLCRCL